MVIAVTDFCFPSIYNPYLCLKVQGFSSRSFMHHFEHLTGTLLHVHNGDKLVIPIRILQ